MALSNSQYDHLMRTYEQKQLDNEFQLRKRYEKAYALIPELEEVDHSISSLSVKKARLLLDGDQTALSSLKSELKELSARKPALLKAHGLPANYLELHYQCPDCKDTGYIGTHKCHCFKKAIVDRHAGVERIQNARLANAGVACDSGEPPDELGA